MKEHGKAKVVVLGVLLMAMVFTSTGKCGSLDDPAAPTDPGSAMYTIEDIYKLLDGDTSVAPRTGAFTEPTSGPTAGTGHTLNDVMDQVKHRSLVGKTGQSTSYATGDDGDLEKGVAWPSPRFTDNGDGTVTDNLTKLIWLKNANCNGLMSWANALTWVNGLASGSCGLTDSSIAGQWRLPNREEMLSLIDSSRYYPALPSGHPFSNVASNYYWLSTTYAGNETTAWSLHLGPGSMTYGGKAAYTDRAWPVRGGQ
jgi:hypothetical protein